VELRKLRAAQSARIIGIEHGAALFRGEAEPAAAVGLEYHVVRFGHSSLTMTTTRGPRRLSSYGASDHAYIVAEWRAKAIDAEEVA